MNRIEGGEEDDERTAEKELARSIDRPAEALKKKTDRMPRMPTVFGTVIAIAARCGAKP